ncbi:hypothetical protein F383_37491 [Gossypium arboreum]|uniref:Uncharacterized protein n=1 Tax=Gossypium arboreum TaxID=29729 RepID=A0A0B0MCG9_GOSAR|nr:hypothetical protein F383_37491 [Gossypium arboreum]
MKLVSSTQSHTRACDRPRVTSQYTPNWHTA